MRGTLIPTPLGWVAVVYHVELVCGLVLPRPSRREAASALADLTGGPVSFERGVSQLEADLQAFFAGRPVGFQQPLDLAWATPFQRRVYQAVMTIPYGSTRSYGWVAEEIGSPRAGRAVGQALGANRLPVLVPCHRVVRWDGAPGGFTGGRAMKVAMLRLEGAST